MPRAPDNPVHKVRCPECGAVPGERCVGGKVHAARRGAAQRRENDEARQMELSDEERIALRRFKCPTCGAKIGRMCEGGKIHGRRLSKVPPKKAGKGSIWTISGGAVDSNRRRH